MNLIEVKVINQPFNLETILENPLYLKKGKEIIEPEHQIDVTLNVSNKQPANPYDKNYANWI